MNAVDTNILIYSIDAADLRKRRSAVELLESLSDADTIIPWQVACEVDAVVNSMKRAGRFEGDCLEAIAALRSCFPVAVPRLAALDRSLRLQRDFQLSTWDSLLIAACAEAGVTRLYTEDMQSRPTIDGIELVNPFA